MTARARWACLLAGATLIALRAPVLVLEPRMWAEEASVYLAYAQSQSFLRSLLFVPTSEGPAGYLPFLKKSPRLPRPAGCALACR